jgi:secernin
MCDTLIALGNSTTDQSVIIAKNSDREPNEVHHLLHVPATKHPDDQTIKCTHIEIPQVAETHEILLMKPHWIWGAEMGANEHGVAIGNEAVWSKEPQQRTGLLGMDLLRLALERGKTAEQALEVIIRLLEQFGQGGICCLKNKKLRYDNSFIIADPHDAWVLETAGRYWIAEKVQDVRSISNCLTIGSEYQRIHPNLIEHAIEKGYCRDDGDFNFASDFSARNIYSWGAKGSKRCQRTQALLEANQGEISVPMMMAFLRDHNVPEDVKSKWRPQKSSMASPCLHASSLLTPDQTTGSYIGHLSSFRPSTHWVTATSAPCLSIFKPTFLGTDIPESSGKGLSAVYNENSLWWRHEVLQRAVIMDYQVRLALFKEDKERLESQFWEETEAQLAKTSSEINKTDEEALARLSKTCFEQASRALEEWKHRVRNSAPKTRAGFFYRRFWKKKSKKVALPAI